MSADRSAPLGARCGVGGARQDGGGASPVRALKKVQRQRGPIYSAGRELPRLALHLLGFCPAVLRLRDSRAGFSGISLPAEPFQLCRRSLPACPLRGHALRPKAQLPPTPLLSLALLQGFPRTPGCSGSHGGWVWGGCSASPQPDLRPGAAVAGAVSL